LSVSERLREREESARQEALELLREQLKTEGQLVAMYNETAPTVEKGPVKHILEMIMLDSRTHIAICKAAIEVLEGEGVFTDDKPVIMENLAKHLEIEDEALKRANKLLQNEWIAETQALNEMIKKLRDDERRHIETMKKLVEKPFFKFDPRDLVVVMRGIEFAEERFKRQQAFKEKQEEA
jgi:rubrerythrin